MEGGNSQEKTVRLLIKTPNQALEDQVVDGVGLNWTVGDLKTRLSTASPLKPPVSDQRLISAGKLLPDHLRFKDIFRQTDSFPTLHLVCARRNLPHRGPQGAQSETRETQQPCASSASPSPPSSSAASSSPVLTQRRRNAPASAAAAPPWTWPAAAMSGASGMTRPTFPAYSLYSPQQLLWLQHIYARQCYMQYHTALVAAGTLPSAQGPVLAQYPPVPAHQVPVPAPLANQNPLPALRDPARNGAFVDPGEADGNLQMNAQGGPVVGGEEEGAERDWLDWSYSATRLCVLLLIVYFNSSLSRFLLVMSTLLLMYLHSVGWFPFRRPQVRGPGHPQPPDVQHDQPNENGLQNHNPAVELADRQREEAAAGADGSDGQGQMTAVLVSPHRVSAMWTAWVFFKTFFSSLIPEAPQGMAN